MGLGKLFILAAAGGAVYYLLKQSTESGRAQSRRLSSGAGAPSQGPSAAQGGTQAAQGQTSGTAKRRSRSSAGRTSARATGGEKAAEPARPIDRQGIEFTGPKPTATHYLEGGPVPEIDDVTLTQQVEAALFKDPTFPRGLVNIRAQNGRVVLRGQLYEQRQIDEAEEVARGVHGVNGVENLLHLAGTVAPNKAAVASLDGGREEGA